MERIQMQAPGVSLDACGRRPKRATCRCCLDNFAHPFSPTVANCDGGDRGISREITIHLLNSVGGSAMTETGRLLGSGKEAEVFEYGALALKLYRRAASKASSFREAANLSILERLALPTPKVHAVGEFDGRWGVLMDRAPISCFADQFVSTAGRAPLEDMAQLHRSIHEKPGDGLPSLMGRLSARIRRAEGLDPASRKRLLLELDSLPDGDRVCHGDFHPWNIHGSGQGFMIVDWLDACCGNPLADVCRTYLLLHHAVPDRAMGYVEAYASVTGSEVGSILAWLPAIAAARLTEGVANENDELLRLAGLSP